MLPPFWDSKEIYQEDWILAKSDEILEQIKDNRKEIKDIKDNHLVSIYKSLGQIKGTLIILVPLVIAILALVIIGLSKGG